MPSLGRRPPVSSTPDPQSLAALIASHLAGLAATNYAVSTVGSRRTSLRHFLQWAGARGVTGPRQLSLAVLEQYQQALSTTRKADGRRRTWGTQAEQLVALKGFLRWCTRTHVLRHNPGEELLLPKRPQRLPRTVLSVSEVERVLAQCDVSEPLGLRDRALLETLYSTGIRRLEAIQLSLTDLDVERGVLLVREGKGQRDRVVPIGQRALNWIDRYLDDARPRLVVPPDRGILFLTRRGKPLRPNRFTERVHHYVSLASRGAATSFATPWPPCCWSMGPTSGMCRRSWATPISRPRPATPMWPSPPSSRCISGPIPPSRARITLTRALLL